MIYNQIVTWTAFAILAMFKRRRVVVMKNIQFPKGEKRRRMSLKVVDIYWRLSWRTRRDIAVYVGRAAVRSGGD